MNKIPCQFPECNFEATHASEAVAIVMLNSHLLSHQQPSGSHETTSQKLPPIQRPEIKQDITEEDWATFVAEWEHFKRCTRISSTSMADHLYQCCEKSLAKLVIRADPEIISKGEEVLLAGIKQLAVIKVATCVRRTNLLATRQSFGEKFREFYANVKAAALTCNYTVKCPNVCCNDHPAVDYSDSVIKDVLIAGIADLEIRKDVLAWTELDGKNVKELVAFVEGKEIAKDALNNAPISGAASISNDQKRSISDSYPTEQTLKAKLALKGHCITCKNEIAVYKRFANGRLNQRPFKSCQKCFKDAKKRSKSTNNGICNNDDDSESSAVTSFLIGSIEVNCRSTVADCPSSTAPPPCSQSLVSTITLNHHIFTNDGWQRASRLRHPSLRLCVSTNAHDYSKFEVPYPKIEPSQIDVIVDSGAQSCLWSRLDFLKCGFSMDHLIPVHHAMKAANTASIEIDGAALIRLSGVSRNGRKVEAAVMVYISPDAKSFFRPREAMVQLGIVSEDFPQLGVALNDNPSRHSIGIANAISEDPKSALAACGCLQREPPPEKPKSLPFPCKSENKTKMKDWLLNRYASSTFNKCPHQLLPTMDGSPVRIHIDPNANPVAFKKPAPIPLHWQDQVERELYQDVELGVLERVPHGG